MQIRRSTGLLVLSLMAAFFLAACGGGGGGGGGGAKTPVTTTLAALPITTDNATLNGAVNPNGDNTVAWFEWGTNSGLSPFNKTPDQTLGSGSADIPLTFKLTGLTTGTTYYFRVAASNSSGTAKGTIVSFLTAAPNTPPSVQTLAATNASITGATLNGSVIPNALATSAWFQWGTDNTFTNPNVTNETVQQPIGSGTTSVQVNATLSNLLVDTVYYFRVVAQNSAGPPQRGLTAQFRTTTLIPAVTTQAADNITTSSANLKGLVNPNGLLTTALFQWGTDNTFATFSTTLSQAMGLGLTAQPINAVVSSLSAGTTYYYRVVANNSAGPSTATFLSFTTPQNPSPNAVAHFNETVWMAGPYGGAFLGDYGATTVTMDASSSTDPYGTITSYLWTKIGGTNTPVLSEPGPSLAAVNTSFSAPQLDYGATDNLIYLLTVTDNRGLSGTDNIWKNIKWGYFDDFSTNSTGTYEVFDTLNTGGTFTYDSSGQRARVVAGDNTGIKFQKFLPENNSGVFSLDFTPTADAGTENISIRLTDTFNTYYELSLSTRGDSKVKKVWAGVEESAAFPFSYSQTGTYSIKITFSPSQATFEATGGVKVDLNPTNTNSLTPVYLEVETTMQSAYYDNIKLEAVP